MKKLNKLFFALAVSIAILCGGVGLNTLGFSANTNQNLSYAATSFQGGVEQVLTLIWFQMQMIWQVWQKQ